VLCGRICGFSAQDFQNHADDTTVCATCGDCGFFAFFYFKCRTAKPHALTGMDRANQTIATAANFDSSTALLPIPSRELNVFLNSKATKASERRLKIATYNQK
jgi:hypothetical protein